MYPKWPRDKNLCQEIHSHHWLIYIFRIMWHPKSELAGLLSRGSFGDLVFRLVLFHQSLPAGIPEFHNRIDLTREETFLFCDPKFLGLLGILMSADSSSYCFLNKPEQEKENSESFSSQNDKLQEMWIQDFQDQA